MSVNLGDFAAQSPIFKGNLLITERQYVVANIVCEEKWFLMTPLDTITGEKYLRSLIELDIVTIYLIGQNQFT